MEPPRSNQPLHIIQDTSQLSLANQANHGHYANPAHSGHGQAEHQRHPAEAHARQKNPAAQYMGMSAQTYQQPAAQVISPEQQELHGHSETAPAAQAHVMPQNVQWSKILASNGRVEAGQHNAT